MSIDNITEIVMNGKIIEKYMDDGSCPLAECEDQVREVTGNA